MGGADNAVDLHCFVALGVCIEDGVHGGGCQHMIAKYGKVFQPATLCFQYPQGRGRGSGFEANAEEHHLPLWIGPRQRQGIADRVHHAHIGAIGFCLQQAAPVTARHPQHIAIAGQDHLRMIQHQAHGHIQAAGGQHADRAAGAVHQFDIVRQQAGDTVAENRMGVAATKFHQPVASVGSGFCPQCRCKPAGALTIAKFVDIFHWALPSMTPISAIACRVCCASSSFSLDRA